MKKHEKRARSPSSVSQKKVNTDSGSSAKQPISEISPALLWTMMMLLFLGMMIVGQELSMSRLAIEVHEGAHLAAFEEVGITAYRLDESTVRAYKAHEYPLREGYRAELRLYYSLFILVYLFLLWQLRRGVPHFYLLGIPSGAMISTFSTLRKGTVDGSLIANHLGIDEYAAAAYIIGDWEITLYLSLLLSVATIANPYLRKRGREKDQPTPSSVTSSVQPPQLSDHSDSSYGR